MIPVLHDISAAIPLETPVFQELPLLILALLALGSTLTGAFPILSSPSYEISLNRIFILAMFFLGGGFPVLAASAASIGAAAVLRKISFGGGLSRFILSGLLTAGGLYFLPGLIQGWIPNLLRPIAVLYSLPLLLFAEILLDMVLLRGKSVFNLIGALILIYSAVLPLTLMTLIMIFRTGPLGAFLALAGLVGLSFIGRSIHRKHRNNTERMAEISRQDRLATHLMESSSFMEFVAILQRELCISSGCRIHVITAASSGAGWVLWGSASRSELKDHEITGTLPEKGAVSRDMAVRGRRGTALGIMENGGMVIFISGRDGENIETMSPELLDNLVLLLSHTWEAVGHSVRSSRSFLAAAVMLARLADSKDSYTHGHSLRVANLSCAVGSALGLPLESMQILRVAAILHDIGKLAIPASILTKKGLLTRKEREIIEAHSAEGARIVSGLSGYETVARVVRSHHESLDGTGYPDGLNGNDIPLMARIIAVADTFDAITSDRSYHSVEGREKALKTIKAESGAKFDARVVKALERCLMESGGEPA